MAQQFALEHDTPAFNPRYADAFVVLAATVLSLATGVWCLLRLELALWAGAVVALAAYAALLSVHLVVRRSLVAADGTEPEDEPVDVWARGPHAPAEPPRHVSAAGEPGADAPRPADPFHFRPKHEPSLPHGPAAPGPAAFAAREPAAAQPDMSVEHIQELIKKLADELNTTTAGDNAEKAGPSSVTEAMISQSVSALQATARTMPGPHANFDAAPGGAAAPGAGVTSWWPTAEPAPGVKPGSSPRLPGTPPALNPQLARIAEAVAAERMEVLLEPIHALAEGRARHFEVSVRLLAADGAALEQGKSLRLAQGSGLMPRIDAAKMIRAARVARRLSERGRQGSVLAAVAAKSLADSNFIFAAAEEPEIEGGMSLVLSFAQSEVRAFTPGHAQALGALATLGYRFALQKVTDLDMDFAGLKDMGFAFVELDAPVFLDGLPGAGDRVPAADICRHLADFGLTLIVGRIEDDWLLARILGFGVLLGKGTLFGEPRLVKDEVVAGPAAA